MLFGGFEPFGMFLYVRKCLPKKEKKIHEFKAQNPFDQIIYGSNVFPFHGDILHWNNSNNHKFGSNVRQRLLIGTKMTPLARFHPEITKILANSK